MVTTGMTVTKAPGARSKAAVDPQFISLLESGCAESRTHIEQMSISFDLLFHRSFPALDPPSLDHEPFLTRFDLAAKTLRRSLSVTDLLSTDQCFISDTVRGWQAVAAARGPETLVEALEMVTPFADDHHFAVREFRIRSRIGSTTRPERVRTGFGHLHSDGH